MKTVSMPLFFMLALALYGTPAWASSKVPAPAEGGAEKKPMEDPAVSRSIDEMNRACASNPLSRVVMPKPKCPKLMEAVVKLGDTAVPAIYRRVLERAQRVAEAAEVREKKTPGQPAIPIRLMMDDSPSIMVSVLGRIATPMARESLVNILAHDAVQRHDAGTCYAVHAALREGRPVEPTSIIGQPNLCQTPSGRAELLQRIRTRGQKAQISNK